MSISRDVQINGVSFKVVVETVYPTRAYGEVRACTAVHEHCFARRIGGVRFVPGAPPDDRTELGELAEAMTWKSALAALPADGEKTVVYCPSGIPQPTEMAEILAAHLAELTVADPGVIFGPDINCNEVVMTRLARVHGAGDHVSGLLEGRGGLSIDGHGYTARGMESALLAAAKRLGWDLSKMSATVQGFGAVGAHTANNLSKHGVAIRAVSTYHGALVSTTSDGLDIGRLFTIWKEQGDESFKQYEDSPPPGTRFVHRDQIFEETTDIFIPAARTDVLAMPGEPQVEKGAKDIQRFAEATGVKVVLEGANHPLTDDAEEYLESRGVFILPDYLVNCGGLIGCWADWVYRKNLEGEHQSLWYDKLNVGSLNYIGHIVGQNIPRVLDITGNSAEGLRRASRDLAADRRRSLIDKFREFSSKDLEGREFARARMDIFLF